VAVSLERFSCCHRAFFLLQPLVCFSACNRVGVGYNPGEVFVFFHSGSRWRQFSFSSFAVTVLFFCGGGVLYIPHVRVTYKQPYCRGYRYVTLMSPRLVQRKRQDSPAGGPAGPSSPKGGTDYFFLACLSLMAWCARVSARAFTFSSEWPRSMSLFLAPILATSKRAFSLRSMSSAVGGGFASLP